MFIKYLNNCKTYNVISVNTLYPEKVLNILQLNGIIVWNVVYEDNSLLFTSLNKDLEKIKSLSSKFGCNIFIKEQSGFIKRFLKIKSQAALICMLGVALAVIMFLSLRIWNISLEADKYESELLNFLYSENIKQSIKKDEIDIEKLSIAILKEFDDFSSININIKGTTLYIEAVMRENPIYEYKKTEPVNLVAKEDALIDSVRVYNGVLMVNEGDYVKKGDILISGEVAYNTFSDDTVVTKKVHAMGEVNAYKEEKISGIIIDMYIPQSGSLYESEYDVYIGNRIFSYSECDDKANKVSFSEKNKKVKITWFEIPVLYDEIKWYNINDCIQKSEYEIASEINDKIREEILSDKSILDITYSTNTNEHNQLEAEATVRYSYNIAIEEIIK